jgi:pseudouridine-5'-phosphate glycosidase
MLPLVVHPDVERALRQRDAGVALETTLVTHGLPHPNGLAVARTLEDVVRDAGATPATIGVLDGAVHVGLAAAALDALASSRAEKVNLSNLAATIASRRAGSTTVAATMAVAAAAGIDVFATGGIGGVHREATETGDVSADLTALSRYRVAVVCAGAKAILDLPRTLEVLETLGVPVLGVGTSRFPAFYRRDSGLPLDAAFSNLDALADAVRTHFTLPGAAGVVVANPIPEAFELSGELYEGALARALSDARASSIRGREVTPFLLDRLRELTGGASVVANRELLRHNARVAAGLAVRLHRRDMIAGGS